MVKLGKEPLSGVHILSERVIPVLWSFKTGRGIYDRLSNAGWVCVEGPDQVLGEFGEISGFVSRPAKGRSATHVRSPEDLLEFVTGDTVFFSFCSLSKKTTRDHQSTPISRTWKGVGRVCGDDQCRLG